MSFGPLTGAHARRACGICKRGFAMAETSWWQHPALSWCCADCGKTDPWRKKQVARVKALLDAGTPTDRIWRQLGLGDRVVRNIVRELRAEKESA